MEIPLKPKVYEILKKYDFELPKTSATKMNLLIKRICKAAKIDTDITKTEIIGGDTITTTHKKYELITSHIARKTGITLLYLNNVPLLEIKSISGHNQISQLLDYISISEEEIAKRLSTNPFFK